MKPEGTKSGKQQGKHAVTLYDSRSGFKIIRNNKSLYRIFNGGCSEAGKLLYYRKAAGQQVLQMKRQNMSFVSVYVDIEIYLHTYIHKAYNIQ